MTELLIGLAQMRCEKGDVAANLAATEDALRQGAERGAAIMCFPEANLTGYVDPTVYPEAILRADDPAIARFIAMTGTYHLTALAGFIEVNPGGPPFITQVVARDGALLGRYRKRTIPDEEAHLFTPATTTPATTSGVFAHPAVPFGVAICADIDNEPLFAEHARGGARLVFEAAAPGLYGDQATRDWRAGFEWWRGECQTKLARYARANGIYIAVATQAGRTRDEDFPGGGYLFGPDGACLAATEDWHEGILWVTVPTAVASPMPLADFNYHLPPELIAQTPIEPRDASRLLVVHRATGTLEHRTFRDIGDELRPGDLLVANRSRVIPARLRGVKEPTGGAVELLLLAIRPDLGPDHWEALVRPGRRLRAGQRLAFGAGALAAEVLDRTEAGSRVVRLEAPDGDVPAALGRVGAVPLPPYIHEPLSDPERYQTVYARTPGSAAAPTAGLHFTPELLAALEARGIGVAYVTLHIGLDTFRPIAEDDVTQHHIHSEEIDLDEATAARINATRAAGGRLVAVGTTAVRVLESAAARAIVGATDVSQTSSGGRPPLVVPFRGRTSLYIVPGHRFRAVDLMLTNFHLPRSTLIVLVSAFAGRELILRAYAAAVAERYRFFSFGDAMLLV
ncbi:MAG TPA: tRNA preQ1(34) S-adenosylmethionine ribosyltransferase-isomerase QueA [Ktedonobacterales bacterium]